MSLQNYKKKHKFDAQRMLLLLIFDTEKKSSVSKIQPWTEGGQTENELQPVEE